MANNKTKEKVMPESSPQTPQNCGVINPYALAEFITGRKIAWKDVPDVPRLFESIFSTPYEELFDPVYKGPLYTGLQLNDKKELIRVHSPLLDVKSKKKFNDLEDRQNDYTAIKTLSDLAEHFNGKNVGDIVVENSQVAGLQKLQLTIRLPETERLHRLAQVFTPAVVSMIAPDPDSKGPQPSSPPPPPPVGPPERPPTPPPVEWSDPGRFFNETAEFFDPIQGQVANCYFIAALSAVAWATPYRIVHMTRATGSGQNQFTNMIRFYQPESHGKVFEEIEVTDALPLTTNGNFMYARSSEGGEIWPAVYEKAYAKYKTGVSDDRPDILQTAWGDCVRATAELTGEHRCYYYTPDYSVYEVWDVVQSNCRGGRTFNPMTASTYSSSAAADQNIHYSDANLVASHCYTILGWAERNGSRYVILRNPWGYKEASTNTLDETVWLYDVSWWRPFNLGVPDGTFALEVLAFKYYFRSFGVVKEPPPPPRKNATQQQ